MQKSVKKPVVYISYAWNSESEVIAKSIEKEFQKKGIRTIRDKANLEYKGRIKPFMREIGAGKYVVLIISSKYLRSEHCMYELLQIFESGDFYERIFPVVLEEVKISKAADRLDLVKYWEAEVEKLDHKIRELKALSNLEGVTDDLNLYAEIRSNIARLTNVLRDVNTLSQDRHISTDFSQLSKLIQEKIEGDLGKLPKNLEFRKKLKSIMLVASIVLITTMGLLVANGFSLFETKDSSKPQTDLETTIDPTPVPEKLTGKKENGDKQTNLTSARNSGETFTVELVVPSNMRKGQVFVDNRPAQIVERNLIFIKVKVPKKKDSHYFEIRERGKSCSTERLISGNDVRLVLCE